MESNFLKDKAINLPNIATINDTNEYVWVVKANVLCFEQMFDRIVSLPRHSQV